ncbi:Breast carcinoma-amplified sequence [Apis cerana cerana]|uniref:Breast carcinoma-amplified sequence n=1 Tax=Apis cerana cerana TaxID=94128 RepID=A0A2A3ESH0_APICC|nr:Breast carcinoma-amplified sequence [Apis cerana cerana]
MSADSPRRGVHKGVQIVSPQPIVDRSIIDSVAGIINDIVPQAYTGTPNSENKESISWARFEYADINDPALYPDYNEGSNTPPLLLVLGYTTGVQVWLIAATGEATEVLSWRQGVVRTLRILPNPKTDDEHVDLFELKRPMVAICDSAGPGPQFCNISFISLKTGEQTKSIKFKNPVCDILANKRSIVVTFLEKIAVFDARTLEDILTVTTCYASPGPNPNPIALGSRWLAYSEKKLLPVKRSSGGCEGEGVQSYTATVLYAAKSLGKGLRGLGETVASSLTGNSVSPVVINNTGSDVTQPGVITILDLQSAKEEKELDDANIETVIAHFTAHSDAIVAMTFDLSGALLMTADKRGHDFHVFRIQPHPGGPTLAAVHHLYILHRGDTTAKVQDMVFSSDTRWAAISTVRGTTHVFPVAPYGGPVGIRTHSTPHVVNRLSRFHRSAGLMDDGTRSHSPVSHTELPLSIYPYSNPRLPPYPHPTVLHPLAQIRQPSSLNHVNSQAQQSRPQQRQRLYSDDSGTLPLKICACFAPPRAWMYAQRESTVKVMKRAVDSLFIMACHGNMIQYDLEPKPVAGVPKEKVCDDTMIELEVEAKGQWPLLRSPNSLEIVPPLPTSSSLLSVNTIPKDIQDGDLAEDRWLSQVEIVTHAGPHRRLWMGPQFVFKTYNATSGAPVNLVEAEAIEIGVTGGSRPARSNPVNMPHAASRSLVPVVIDGSGSSYEQSPRFMEAYGDPLDSENAGVGGENQLREDLAEAMLETSIAPHRAPGRRSVFERVGQPVTKVVNPLGTVITVSADEEDINSSQEFDSSEESHMPEPPRSVCAEEGPASLGDFEPESQTLRNLTKICAEMRSASEPAIDSVPDENICEVKERKTLCVEIASITNPGNSTIDFERVEAFRDVPTGLNLCVEQGEIPSSPMTQAKETAWYKKLNKREDAHERSVSEAQYVVSCDEDSVVLMENKAAQGRKTASTHCRAESKRASEHEKVAKKSGRNGTSSGKRADVKTPTKRYVLKEHEDSIVIEDTCSDSRSSSCGKKRGCEKIEDTGKHSEYKGGESLKETGKVKGRSKSSTVHSSCKETTTSELAMESKSSTKHVESIIELDSITEETDKKEDFKSTLNVDVLIKEMDKYKSPASDSTDDFSCSEYHIVDAPCCNKDGTSVQSDEDIEHIQSSEISQLQQAECIDGDKCVDVISCAGSSPIMQRKNSKNTISDDDIEYIHSSEVETPEKACKEDTRFETSKGSSDSESTGTRCKLTFSDDDLEHVHHSDVYALLPEKSKEVRERSAARRSHEISTEQQQQGSRIKSSKKSKDIVVIESDTSAADVTVIFKPVESWKSKSTERRDEAEEAGLCMKDIPASENPSPMKRAKIRPVKTSPSNVAPKRSQAGIEIIDIDAMQKAEMDVLADAASVSECKILAGPEVCGTRARKSRKNKKANNEGKEVQSTEILIEAVKTVEETGKESSLQEVEFSWSAVVKKKSGSPVAEPETRKEKEEEEGGGEGEGGGGGGGEEEQEEEKKKMEEDKVKQSSFEVSPILEKIESLKKKIHESSLRKSLDKKSCVLETYPEESSVQSSEISWSSIVKKKNLSSVDLEARKEAELDPIVEESSVEEKKTHRKRIVESLLSQSSTMGDQSKEAERSVDESCDQSTEGSSWSFIVKKKATTAETVTRKEHIEQKSQRKLDLITDSLEITSDRETKSVNGSSKSCEKTSKLETVSEMDERGSKNWSIESLLVDPVFTKEDSSEPERDTEPEKRSDSEQEIVPERSSSSDELNANVVFTNNEGEYSGREVTDRGAMNGSSSVSGTKKSNRSKKKKRR